LKIETQTLEDHQVKLVVEFEPEAFEKFKHQAARKISQESKIPGFRPGKAPYEVVRRMFGEPSIANRALDLLIDGTYAEMIEKAEITPSGPGKLDKVVNLDPPKLEILVPLLPTVELGNYRSIRLDYLPKQVSPEEVDQFIERLRTNYASVEPVERPIQETDLVFLNLSGSFASPAEGEAAEYVKETPQQVIVQKEEEQKTEEWPFPGFTRQLIGLSAGNEKTLSFTYPEDAKEEKLRGKEVEFHVQVQSVKAMKLPDLNEEFAQTVGEFDSVETMRKSISDRLEQNAREEYDQDYYTQVIDKVREHATLKYPPQVLEEEIEHVLSHLQQDLTRQKLDLDTYLKMRKLEKDAFIENEVKPSAIRRLERSLIMDEIARAEKLEIDPSKLEGAISETVRQMDASGEYQKARKNITQEKLADAVAIESASRLLNQQTLERIKQIATGQSETMTAPEPQTEEGERTPATQVTDEEKEKVIEETKPEAPLGDTSAEQ
jgi:trigger factor